MISDGTLDAIRRFNRLYTTRIGVLQQKYLASDLSLTEVRVLYELGHRDRPGASELSRELGLDAGYLSRILQRFERRGLLKRPHSETDGRRTHNCLTKRGQQLLASLETQARNGVREMLAPLSGSQQGTLVGAMESIENLLAPRVETAAPYVIRNPQPGDMGWVVHRLGVLYFQEFGFDSCFEALVSKIVAEFIEN